MKTQQNDSWSVSISSQEKRHRKKVFDNLNREKYPIEIRIQAIKKIIKNSSVLEAIDLEPELNELMQRLDAINSKIKKLKDDLKPETVSALYILYNPIIDKKQGIVGNLIKVGRTTRHPFHRLQELTYKDFKAFTFWQVEKSLLDTCEKEALNICKMHLGDPVEGREIFIVKDIFEFKSLLEHKLSVYLKNA